VVADVAKLAVGREEYYTRELATDHQQYLSGHGESPGPAMGEQAFAQAVTAQLPRLGGQRRCHQVLRAFYAAAADGRKLLGEQTGAAERGSLVLADLLAASAAVTEVEARMLGVLDALGLAELCCSIPGLSAVGAAAILAETGDPARYDTGRAWAKHAGICPRDNHSGGFRGQTKTSGRGRPLLRTAAWRAIWGCCPTTWSSPRIGPSGHCGKSARG